MTAIRLTAHTRADYAIAHVPPAEAQVMGGFASARYDRDIRGYLVPVDHIDAFRRYLAHHDHTLDDHRSTPGSAIGPLPECANCGTPARRNDSDRLRRCAGCGQPWRPIQQPPVERAVAMAVAVCDSCGTTQARRVHCHNCGDPLPTRALHPLVHFEPSQPLADPLPVADTVTETTTAIREQQREVSA